MNPDARHYLTQALQWLDWHGQKRGAAISERSTFAAAAVNGVRHIEPRWKSAGARGERLNSAAISAWRYRSES